MTDRPHVSKAVPYKDRLTVTIPEAMRWTGRSRAYVESLLADGSWLFVTEGDFKRKRIVVRSVIRWLTQLARDERNRLGFDPRDVDAQFPETTHP